MCNSLVIFVGTWDDKLRVQLWLICERNKLSMIFPLQVLSEIFQTDHKKHSNNTIQEQQELNALFYVLVGKYLTIYTNTIYNWSTRPTFIFYSFLACSTSAWSYSWLGLTWDAGRGGEWGRVRGSKEGGRWRSWRRWRWCSMCMGRRLSVRFWGTRRINLVQKIKYKCQYKMLKYKVFPSKNIFYVSCFGLPQK